MGPKATEQNENSHHTHWPRPSDRCSVNLVSAHHRNTETKAVMLESTIGFGTFLKIEAIKKIPTLVIKLLLPHYFLLYSWLSIWMLGSEK